jgi:hypothetical protein
VVVVLIASRSARTLVIDSSCLGGHCLRVCRHGSRLSHNWFGQLRVKAPAGETTIAPGRGRRLMY